MFSTLIAVLFCPLSLTLGETRLHQRRDVIQKFEVKSTCTLNDIPTWLMKSIIDNIAEPVLDIMKNSSLLSGTVPDPASKYTESIPNIYFKAHLSHGSTIGFNSNVRFNNVDYNSGNHYNPTSGVFTAPVTGLYQFMVHVQSTSAGVSSYKLVNEGVTDIHTSIHSAFDVASFTTILRVSKGHHVSVRKVYDERNAQMYGSTAFAGYLLRHE